MQALQSLTELFSHHVTEAKSLDVWAEDGELLCTQGSIVDGFEIAYTVNINMTAVDVKPHILMMHLVSWLNKYDVQRDEKGLLPPSFATELLDKGLCDIKLKVDIQESYSLNENAQGNWKQEDTRYECVSEFAKAAIETELPPLKYIGGNDGDFPSCS
ncbi:phage tail protein [Aliivibrio sp. SR45-2]|uniref:phage tail protein n=1 Tax=Aliivibrio sp. SR45-2 TaxID=2760931 RepID=UPI0015FD61F0|nr:phage tail protein [Aliivibrio sp. SR45-2]MBB1312499.1 phage tail protein [Aliivibrio sp. SR45-2]